MTGNWQEFWDNYRIGAASSDADLFVQVGQTIDGKPIPEAMFQKMVKEVAERLNLNDHDYLLDLCCGNGLFSYVLAPLVDRVTAVDFAAHLIADAMRLKLRSNIRYQVGDVSAPIEELVDDDAYPTKVLMNYSLAYFDPAGLDKILGNLLEYMKGRPFTFLLTGIPNDELKWNFYNTPERKARHAENQSQRSNLNDGMGRWWSEVEIKAICLERGLKVDTLNHSQEISNYRMSALISSG